MSNTALPLLRPRVLDWDDDEEVTKPDGRRDLPMRDLVREPREGSKEGQ